MSKYIAITCRGTYDLENKLHEYSPIKWQVVYTETGDSGDYYTLIMELDK